MKWYLLQTKPNGHITACKHLRHQNFTVFSPFIIKTSKKNQTFVNAKAPLFPGYLFMGTLINPVPWKSINATRGISKAVTLDGIYRPINTCIIEDLQCRCDKNGIIKNMDEIVSGDRVKIERGPFSEFICNVEKIEDDKRAWVLIELMHQQTKVKVWMEELTKIY